MLVSLQLNLWGSALHTGVQCCNALQHCSRQNSSPTVLCWSAKQAHSMVVSLQLNLWRSALHTGVQWCNTNALQHWSGQNSFPTVLYYRCTMMQHQSTAPLVRAEQLPQCSVLLCETGSQHGCVSAIKSLEICPSYRCTVMQHQCTAALVKAG